MDTYCTCKEGIFFLILPQNIVKILWNAQIDHGIITSFFRPPHFFTIMFGFMPCLSLWPPCRIISRFWNLHSNFHNFEIDIQCSVPPSPAWNINNIQQSGLEYSEIEKIWSGHNNKYNEQWDCIGLIRLSEWKCLSPHYLKTKIKNKSL